MATTGDMRDYICEKLGNSQVFSTRSMFGEYALYANGKVVGFICDNLLYVKIFPESSALETVCEKGEAYPGSRLYYIVDEIIISNFPDLPNILCDIAKIIPEKRKIKK